MKIIGSKTDEVSTIPECWRINQFKNLKKKYDGLILHNERFGCDYCGRFASTSAGAKGIHLSMEWANCRIVALGKDKKSSTSFS